MPVGMRLDGFRVLLVDDAPEERRAWRTCVECAFPHAHVEEAMTPDEALGMLRRRDYSLVIVDAAMGVRTGTDLLAIAAREHPWTLRVLITASPDHVFSEEAAQRGHVHALLPKAAAAGEGADVLRRLAGATSA